MNVAAVKVALNNIILFNFLNYLSRNFSTKLVKLYLISKLCKSLFAIKFITPSVMLDLDMQNKITSVEQTKYLKHNNFSGNKTDPVT